MRYNMKKETIDVIVTWVDGKDPAWLKERSKYTSSKESSSEKYFRDWDTLRYLFRSFEYFMPWINKIHFVTYGHLPSWMNTASEKLHIVKHSDFFEKTDYLPVFNSSAIEANLHLIPNLSDKFIYFNDDMLVLKPLEIERYFVNGKPLDFIHQGIPRRGFLYKKLRSNEVIVDIMSNELKHLNSFFSKKELLKKQPSLFYSKNYSTKWIVMNFIFNTISSKYLWLNTYHHPQPYLKNTLIEAHSLYNSVFNEVSKNKFRSRNDVCQYLYREIQLAKGDFYPYEPKDCYCLNISSAKLLNKNINKIQQSSFFCANDHTFLTNQEFEIAKYELTKILDSILPLKSSFEL